jgi:hypothetical protein
LLSTLSDEVKATQAHVHTPARTIDGDEQQLLWPYDLHQFVDVIKDADHHFLLCQLDLLLIRMAGLVDDAVGIQVQIVNVRRCLCGRELLVEERVALA